MLNRICIEGRMVVDPDMRTTPSGVSVTTFRIACAKDVKNKQTGERDVDFVNIVAWRNTAEYVAQWGKKGRHVIVTGRLQIRQYTTNEGEKRTVAEVNADNVYFTDTAEYRQDSTPSPNDYVVMDDDDADIPF